MKRFRNSKRRKVNRTLTVHHRKPKALGGTDDESNLSILTLIKHRSYHHCFGVMTPEEIARELSDVYIDPEYVLIAVKRSVL